MKFRVTYPTGDRLCASCFTISAVVFDCYDNTEILYETFMNHSGIAVSRYEVKLLKLYATDRGLFMQSIFVWGEGGRRGGGEGSILLK